MIIQGSGPVLLRNRIFFVIFLGGGGGGEGSEHNAPTSGFAHGVQLIKCMVYKFVVKFYNFLTGDFWRDSVDIQPCPTTDFPSFRWSLI